MSLPLLEKPLFQVGGHYVTFLGLIAFAALFTVGVIVARIVGQVKQIRARSTVIMTNDGIAMIVPNEKFIDSPVTNWTYSDPRVRFRLPVGVAYGSDVNKVREALIAAAREHPATLSDPKPDAFLEKFGDSTIEFQLV